MVLVGLTLAGCGGGNEPVPIEDPGPLPAIQQTSCHDFLDRLPTTLQEESRREVTPGDVMGAAYGDPATEIRCVDPARLDLPKAMACQSAAGVDWYAPTWMLENDTVDVVMVTVGRQPAIQVYLPASRRPPMAVMVGLAPAIKAATEKTKGCE